MYNKVYSLKFDSNLLSSVIKVLRRATDRPSHSLIQITYNVTNDTKCMKNNSNTEVENGAISY